MGKTENTTTALRSGAGGGLGRKHYGEHYFFFFLFCFRFFLSFQIVYVFSVCVCLCVFFNVSMFYIFNCKELSSNLFLNLV